jgi:chondroitin AC lyase
LRRLLILTLTFLATNAFAADIDLVRTQFVSYYTAAGASATAPRMRDALGALESHARSVTAPGHLLSDGTWSDIDYKQTPAGGWGPWDHSRRLIVMAKAYRTPGQPLYRNATLLAQINASLAQVKSFYGATILPNGNWWFWTIGIPIDLGPTLILMGDEIDPQVREDLVLAIQTRILNSPMSRGIVGPTPTGENLVWSSWTHLCLALLRNDQARLSLVRGAMAGVTLPATGEGVKSDMSFHQHGAQLYTGGYGGSFANDVARYALITRGTSYALPQASLDAFSDYVADGIAWALYGNYFDVSVVGREVARSSTTGFHGIASLVQMAAFETRRSADIRAAAAKMLETWRHIFPPELAPLAVQAERGAAAWPAGHRHYFASDYTVHRRPGWFASVKMFSTRTKSGESTNAENIRGARQSDGRFYLVLGGDEYFGRDIWPALDWTRLPGITVEQKADTASATYGYGRNAFAGGTGDGRNGVSAMELTPLGSSLTAKKAWFFFDDAIVFLTNSITSPSANRVETIVNQWPLVNAASQVVRGSNWAVLENVGYWFPTSAAPLQTIRETRTGTWAALGGSSDTTEHAKPIVTLLLDHGTNPTLATAEYAIVPNMTADAMRTWAASAPLQILANTPIASAVRNRRDNSTGITFWTAGSIDGISSDAPAVVYLSGTTLSAADPTAAATGTFRVTIPGAYTTTDVPYSTTSRSTTLTIPRAGGRTTTVTLKVKAGKRRAA